MPATPPLHSIFERAAAGTAAQGVLLLRAIAQDDHAAFQSALAATQDVNMHGGVALHVAAAYQNPLMMRLLVAAGADIAYAVKSLGEQQQAIARTKYYDDYHEAYMYKYRSKEEEKHYKELGTVSSTLENFAKKYREELAAMENIRLQNAILGELRALRQEIHAAFNDSPLHKKQLSAPAHKKGA